MICLRSHSSAESWDSSTGFRNIIKLCPCILGFPSGVVVTNQPINARVERAWDSIPGSKRSAGVGNGNPLQYSCLENPMDSEAWLVTLYGAKMEFSVDKLRGEYKNHLKLYMCVYYTHIHIYIYTYTYIYVCVYSLNCSPVQCRYDISLSLISLACILLEKEQYLTTIIKIRMLNINTLLSNLQSFIFYHLSLYLPTILAKENPGSCAALCCHISFNMEMFLSFVSVFQKV